jgi:hypothetical protein
MIEFSRISTSRGGVLTLVIDPEHGVPVSVAWCFSRRQTVSEVVEDLRARERTTVRNIGFVTADGKERCHDEASLMAIRTWTAEGGLDGAVWTDLQSNFLEKSGEPFSVDAAIRYLNCLKGQSRTQALEYLERASAFVCTPLRDAFNAGSVQLHK